MIIYSNENNLSTLKLMIAANLSSQKVEIKNATFTDPIFNGPKYLPILEVNESLRFFSSNAAVSYLLHSKEAVKEQCQQYLEWEAVRLSPVLQSLSKANSDVVQMATALLKDLDKILSKDKFMCGPEITSSDISIWCSLYNLNNNKDLKELYLGNATNIQRWYQEMASLKYVQDAIAKWSSNNSSVGATSAYGVPQVSTLTPSTPEEPVVSGPTAEEIEKAKELWLNGSKGLKPLSKQDKVILPVKGRKNVLITSALPYVNNVPHLGNIIGCVLSADIFARYCRLCDYNALFICGTDEYGTATETKALEEGLTPREICDKYYAIHNDVYRWFNIGFDHFGRTSTQEQTKITQAMFTKLRENGFILTQSVDQLLCTKCDRFLADRFVEGQCHHPGCLYENARGDQCDKCGKLINAVELINPKCKVCGETPILKASEQLFLELGQLEPSVRSWVSKSDSNWSPSAKAVSRSWLREGLRARAITRDLKWGVPVPQQGFQNKVFYVWFDAPMGYMSITECATKQYEKWWKPEKEMNVELYQFMAKDNVPFHAVMFPATLLGVNEGHVLVKHLFATEYLNYEEGKFSKSRGVGVFGTDAQDTGIPADVWRFYLASIRPESSDSSFSWVELGTRNNSELLNNLGNFCHRSLSFCANSFKGQVPNVVPSAKDYELIALINREIVAYVTQMCRGRLREALKHVLLISKLGNQHMQSEQPWVLLKGNDNDKIRGSSAIGLCCQIAATLCALISPYMPETSRRLVAQLNLTIDRLRIDPENPSLLQLLPEGHVIGKPEPLFTKIELNRLEELKTKYAGTQSDRQNGVPADSITELESAIAKQGEKVRQLKSSTKDKSVWQPEVNILLDLKKKLTELQKNPPKSQAKPVASSVSNVQELEAAIAAQGDKVRQLKASTKDKSVWQPEVNKLLELKKNLVELQKAQTTPAAPSASVADLEAAIAKQGDKVRQLKSSTKDKSVWQPEVNILLDLKKQLANLQIK